MDNDNLNGWKQSVQFQMGNRPNPNPLSLTLSF
jgi:hypothetical protein